MFYNTDVSWKTNSAGLAWIFSDQSESEIAHKTISLDCVPSPCMAEALAIQDLSFTPHHSTTPKSFFDQALKCSFEQSIRGNERSSSSALLFNFIWFFMFLVWVMGKSIGSPMPIYLLLYPKNIWASESCNKVFCWYQKIIENKWEIK